MKAHASLFGDTLFCYELGPFASQLTLKLVWCLLDNQHLIFPSVAKPLYILGDKVQRWGVHNIERYLMLQANYFAPAHLARGWLMLLREKSAGTWKTRLYLSIIHCQYVFNTRNIKYKHEIYILIPDI